MNNRPSLARVHIIAVIVALTGCQAKRIVALSSDVRMADRSSARQLIDGFHGVEEDKWRWTARRFAVVLQPPAGSDRTGATLRLQLYIPDSEIATLGPITLTADVNEVSLLPETFTKAGRFSYSRTVPPALLSTDLLPVVFNFDKALSTPDDRRELAAVVTEVSLERNN